MKEESWAREGDGRTETHDVHPFRIPSLTHASFSLLSLSGKTQPGYTMRLCAAPHHRVQARADGEGGRGRALESMEGGWRCRRLSGGLCLELVAMGRRGVPVRQIRVPFRSKMSGFVRSLGFGGGGRAGGRRLGNKASSSLLEFSGPSGARGEIHVCRTTTKRVDWRKRVRN